MTNIDFAQYVRRICETGSIDFGQVAKSLNLQSDELSDRLGNLNSMGASFLSELSEQLNVTSDALITRTVDFNTLAKSKFTPAYLPERYQIAAASQIRTVFPVMHYLESRSGGRLVRNILRDLKVGLSAFSDPTRMVSTHLLRDILSRLEVRGFGPEDFFEIGYDVVHVPAYESVAAELSECTTTQQMYELCFESIVPQYEKNFVYSVVRSRSDSMRIRISPNPEIQDALGDHLIDSKAMGFYKAGQISGHRRFMGLRGAIMRQISSIHEGSDSYQYELSWKSA